MNQASPELWNCPLCSHRVPYGAACPGEPETCERGVKNIIWQMRQIKGYHAITEPAVGVGISEIANEEA